MTNSTSGRPGRGRPSREVIYKRFATAIDELANYGGLPKPYEAKSLWDHLWHLEAHHSTAIEETLSSSAKSRPCSNRGALWGRRS